MTRARLCKVGICEVPVGISAYKAQVQEAEATLGPFHPDLTENLEALAKIYESYGETRKAKRCYARILKIWEKVLAPDYGLKCFLADILGIPLSKQPPKIFINHNGSFT